METASCGWVRRFVGPWKDGELDPADAARIENHIAGCASCAAQARFEKWFSGEVRRRVDRPQAPARLADRISLELRREYRRQRVRRTALAFGGFAAAAGLAAVVAFGLRDSPTARPPDGVRAAVPSETGAGRVWPSTQPAPPGFRFSVAGEDDLAAGRVAADIVDRHDRFVHHALPLETASYDPGTVGDWFRDKLPFQVVAPRFQEPDARLLGGRLSHVQAQDAAYLAYDVGGRRMSVIVLPAGSVRVGGTPVTAGGRTVFLSSRQGVTAAVVESDGLLYALVSDISPDTLLHLASQIRATR
ncbi:MAG: zf-HC2 domain-containing protein [Deltaproteobacteria bacterium]|nr:zf-HC2 domain-containing protein [Deltaproteobacteria bacterium]